MNFCQRLHHTRTPRKMKKRVSKMGILWNHDRFMHHYFWSLREEHGRLLRMAADALRLLREQDATDRCVIDGVEQSVPFTPIAEIVRLAALDGSADKQ